MRHVTVRIDLALTPDVWTSIPDVVASAGVTLDYGIRGTGPLDRTAAPGRMTFALRNDAGNAVGVQGAYAPGHVHVRAGFGVGTPVRLVLTRAGTAYVKFRGRLTAIQPDPGRGRQQTTCEAADWLETAATTRVRVPAQVDQRADELLTTIVNALPADARPVTTDVDQGVSTFPYALYDLDAEEPALRAIAKVVQSELGYCAVIGDTADGGRLRFWHRHARARSVSQITLDDETLVGLTAAAADAHAITRVRVATHPIAVGAEPVPLVALADVPWLIAPGETRTLTLAARTDPGPTEAGRRLGGLDGLPLEAGTDYAFTAWPDGSGDDLTATLTVTATYHAATADVTLTNTGPRYGYVTRLEGRARPVVARPPVTTEAVAPSGGGRDLAIDLPYEANANIGQALADAVLHDLTTTRPPVETVRFLAHASDARLEATLAREPGDRVTVTEPVTGLDQAAVIIQAVRLTIRPGPAITCEWTVAPAPPGGFFMLDQSRLDEGVLGYA